MGWGLILKHVYINKIRKNEIEHKIKECESMIEYCQKNLIALASASPRDVKINNETITWEEHVLTETERLVDEIRENESLLNLLYIAQESNGDDIEEDY